MDGAVRYICLSNRLSEGKLAPHEGGRRYLHLARGLSGPMDLPPCPSCGEDLDPPSSQGPAKCRSCGFSGPVDVDRKAISRLLDDASQRGLGPQPRLAPSTDAPEPRLEGKATPSLLDGPRAPELPQLSPPPVPRELAEGTPPLMADPREPLPNTRGDVTRTPLEDDLDQRKDARERQLKARGEILR